MFKANLIENQSYYHLRRKSLITMLVISVLMGITSNIFSIPVWMSISVVLVMIGIFYYDYKNRQNQEALTQDRRIEIDENEVRIFSSSGLKSIELVAVSEIIINEQYRMPEEKLAI